MLQQTQIHERGGLSDSCGDERIPTPGTRRGRDRPAGRKQGGESGNRGIRGNGGNGGIRGDLWIGRIRGDFWIGRIRGDLWNCRIRGDLWNCRIRGDLWNGRNWRYGGTGGTGGSGSGVGSRGIGGDEWQIGGKGLSGRENGGKGHVTGLGVSVKRGVLGGRKRSRGRGGDERQIEGRHGIDGGIATRRIVGGKKRQRVGGDRGGLMAGEQSDGEIEDRTGDGERSAGLEVLDVLADDVDVVRDGVADGETGLCFAEIEEKDPVFDVEGVEVVGMRGVRMTIGVQKIEQRRDVHFFLENSVDEADEMGHVTSTTEHFED